MDAAKIREKGEDSVDRKGGCDFVLRLFFFFLITDGKITMGH